MEKLWNPGDIGLTKRLKKNFDKWDWNSNVEVTGERAHEEEYSKICSVNFHSFGRYLYWFGEICVSFVTDSGSRTCTGKCID